MKRIRVFILAAALVAAISAPALAAPAAKDAPVQILTAVSTKEYKTPDGQVVMTVYAEVPVLSGGPSEAAAESINAGYREVVKDYFASLEKEYLQEAIMEADRLKEIGTNYGFYKSFNITYNANGLLSVFFDNSYDMTGAHPTSIFNGETYDLRTGKKLALGDIVSDVPAVMQKLFKKVDAYLKKNELVEYAQVGGGLLEQQYDQSDFVLTNKGIRFFFQQYVIAPYSEGMPSFDLAFKELGPLLVPAKAAKINAAENEIRETLFYLLDQNSEAVRDIFVSGTLKTGEGSDGLLEVIDARFETYKEFKDYLGRTYTKKCVDALLKGSWYVDKGGKLYVDSAKVATKPVDGDRSSYTYSLSNATKSKATLTVDFSDAAGAQKRLTIPLKKENGRWRMEAMM